MLNWQKLSSAVTWFLKSYELFNKRLSRFVSGNNAHKLAFSRKMLLYYDQDNSIPVIFIFLLWDCKNFKQDIQFTRKFEYVCISIISNRRFFNISNRLPISNFAINFPSLNHHSRTGNVISANLPAINGCVSSASISQMCLWFGFEACISNHPRMQVGEHDFENFYVLTKCTFASHMYNLYLTFTSNPYIKMYLTEEINRLCV